MMDPSGERELTAMQIGDFSMGFFSLKGKGQAWLSSAEFGESRK